MPIIEWKEPIQVTDGGRLIDVNVDPVDNDAGIYFFSRTYNDGPFDPFYVGKTVHLRTRLNQYLYSQEKHEKKIRSILLNVDGAAQERRVANGPRFFHHGHLLGVQGQQKKPTIDKAERALIHYTLITGGRLVNHALAGRAAVRAFDMKGNDADGFLPKVLFAPK